MTRYNILNMELFVSSSLSLPFPHSSAIKFPPSSALISESMAFAVLALKATEKEKAEDPLLVFHSLDSVQTVSGQMIKCATLTRHTMCLIASQNQKARGKFYGEKIGGKWLRFLLLSCPSER